MRTDALSIELRSSSSKDKLAEEYGKVIENIKHISLAMRLKNTDLSGDPLAGSVEAKRFVNAQGKAYGTARKNGKGDAIKAEPVTISINDDTEYIEEVEEKDLMMYGVNGLIERRTANHQDGLAVELDTKFFAEACDAGSSIEIPSSVTHIADELELAIQTVETVKNDFVQGVPRNLIEIVATPETFGKLRNKININASNSVNLAQLSNYEEVIFNNAKINSNVFLPDSVEYLVMVKGAVAQPVRTSIYNPAKVEFSDATAFGLFAYKGTKAVMSDLIFVKGGVE